MTTLTLPPDLDQDVDLSQHVEWWVEISRVDRTRLTHGKAYWFYVPTAPEKIVRVRYNAMGKWAMVYNLRRKERYYATHIWMGFGAPQHGPGDSPGAAS